MAKKDKVGDNSVEIKKEHKKRMTSRKSPEESFSEKLSSTDAIAKLKGVSGDVENEPKHKKAKKKEKRKETEDFDDESSRMKIEKRSAETLTKDLSSIDASAETENGHVDKDDVVKPNSSKKKKKKSDVGKSGDDTTKAKTKNIDEETVKLSNNNAKLKNNAIDENAETKHKSSKKKKKTRDKDEAGYKSFEIISSEKEICYDNESDDHENPREEVSNKAKESKKKKGTKVDKVVTSAEDDCLDMKMKDSYDEETKKNDEENIKGIFNEMDSAVLKKVKKKTEKRKKTNSDDILKEAPQNGHKIPEKKKKKTEENSVNVKVNEEDEALGEKEKSKEEIGIEYLLQWKNDRRNWSFKKVRQTWLLRNMYDQNKVSANHFKILQKYLKDLKGKSREESLSKAKEILEKEEIEATVEDNDEKAKQTRAVKITKILS